MASRYSMNELARRALKVGDISWDMNRLYRDKVIRNDPKAMTILGLGHVVATMKWIESMTDEGMQYGRATKDERINYAAEHARLAGIKVVDVAEALALTHVLPLEMLLKEPSE